MQKDWPKLQKKKRNFPKKSPRSNDECSNEKVNVYF